MREGFTQGVLAILLAAAALLRRSMLVTYQAAPQTNYGRKFFVCCSARQSLPNQCAAHRLVLHSLQNNTAGVRPQICISAAAHSTALMEAAPQPLKKARKAKDLTANKPVPPSTPEQLVGVKQEVNGDGHVTSTPFLVVQTEGLAAAEALTGSAEPSVQPPKRAKKKKAAIRPAASAPTAVSAAPTPLLSAEEQQRQPAGAQAGLAAADSSRGERQQQAGAHLDSMPQIPATDAAKPRARGRKKGAAAPAIEAGATAAVKSEDAPAEAPAAKGRKRASKAVKAQSVPEVAIDAVTDTAAAAPAQAKAPRRKKAAPKADMAATEVLFLHCPALPYPKACLLAQPPAVVVMCSQLADQHIECCC